MDTTLKLSNERITVKALILFIICALFMMISPIVSEAATKVVPTTGSGVVTYTISGVSGAELETAISNMKHNEVEAGAGKIVSGTPVFSASGNTITVDYAEMQNGSTASQRKVLGSFVDELNKSQLTQASKSNAMNQISSYDDSIDKLMIPIIMDATSADLYEASKIVNPFLPIVRVIFGILTIAISILLIGSTIIDLIFIGFPLAREVFNKDGSGGGGGGGRIPWVTNEANSVINETEGSGGGDYKNAYFLYFKRRLVSYIVLAFCLLYLVLGELGGLIGWLLTLGEGLVE